MMELRWSPGKMLDILVKAWNSGELDSKDPGKGWWTLYEYENRYPKAIVTSITVKRYYFHDSMTITTQFSSDAYFSYLYNMSTVLGLVIRS